MSARGFTLLEVLAAALILGFAFTALLGIQLDSARAEGRSLRRIEAGIIADDRLADLEAGLLTDEEIQRGDGEGEVGDFRYTTHVGAFLIPGMQAPSASGPTSIATPGAARGAAAADAAPPASLVQLLSANMKGAASQLVRLEVVVSWGEGEDEQSVSRTTFAFDRAAAISALEEIRNKAQGGGDDQTGGQSDDSGSPTPSGLPNPTALPGGKNLPQNVLDALRKAR